MQLKSWYKLYHDLVKFTQGESVNFQEQRRETKKVHIRNSFNFY